MVIASEVPIASNGNRTLPLEWRRCSRRTWPRSFARQSANRHSLACFIGVTAVFLFGLTRAPAAQPRSLFGGHLGGALIGVCCYQFLGDATWVYILAFVLALMFMLVTKTVHPPAGANPLLMLHAHAGFAAVLQPVGLGIVILTLVAIAWSRILPGTDRYPVRWMEKSPPSLFWGGWVE